MSQNVPQGPPAPQPPQNRVIIPNNNQTSPQNPALAGNNPPNTIAFPNSGPGIGNGEINNNIDLTGIKVEIGSGGGQANTVGAGNPGPAGDQLGANMG